VAADHWPLERQQRRAAARRCEASLDYDPKAASVRTVTDESEDSPLPPELELSVGTVDAPKVV
jgi:hypothetical protein